MQNAALEHRVETPVRERQLLAATFRNQLAGYRIRTNCPINQGRDRLHALNPEPRSLPQKILDASSGSATNIQSARYPQNIEESIDISQRKIVLVSIAHVRRIVQMRGALVVFPLNDLSASHRAAPSLANSDFSSNASVALNAQQFTPIYTAKLVTMLAAAPASPHQ